MSKEDDSIDIMGKIFVLFLGLFFGMIGTIEILDGNLFSGIPFVVLRALFFGFSTKICRMGAAFFDKLRLKIPPHITATEIILIILSFITGSVLLFSAADVIFNLNIMDASAYVNGHLYTGSAEDIRSILLSSCGAFFVILLFLGAGYSSLKKREKLFWQYYQYLEDNDVKLGLFVRPYYSKSNIVLANKFLVFEFDVSDYINGRGKIKLTDKIKKRVYEIDIYVPVNTRDELFIKLCENFGYNTQTNDILISLAEYETRITYKDIEKEIYLDINTCSEAELTAIPGINIAKAKHVKKVRKKQIKFLTMNQFYNVINLEEEFLEQIHTRGTKIILNELPMYLSAELQNNSD